MQNSTFFYSWVPGPTKGYQLCNKGVAVSNTQKNSLVKYARPIGW